MKKLAFGSALVLGSLALSGCAPAVSNVQLYSCIHYTQTPTEYTPYCADLSQDFTNITWSSWGDKTAVGNATAVTNLCEPTCSAGKKVSTTATLTLEDPIKDFGKQVFSKLTVHYSSVPTGHTQDEKLSIITSNPYG